MSEIYRDIQSERERAKCCVSAKRASSRYIFLRNSSLSIIKPRIFPILVVRNIYIKIISCKKPGRSCGIDTKGARWSRDKILASQTCETSGMRAKVRLRSEGKKTRDDVATNDDKRVDDGTEDPRLDNDDGTPVKKMN